MNKLCKQVSIESPALQNKECVFNFIVPVSDPPPLGARVLVVYAGACYSRNRDPSYSSSFSNVSSISADLKALAMEGPIESQVLPPLNAGSAPSHGMRDGAFYPGFEVAGVIESLGSDLTDSCGFKVGQRVILYPFEDAPAGYSELMVVPELKYLVPVPDNLELSIAAMLPTGALLAMNAVLSASKILEQLAKERGPKALAKILIVGTGGLALWAVRISAEHFYHSEARENIKITVACLRDEGLQVAKDLDNVNVVQWNEDLYEKQIIERTQDACGGKVDIVFDFCTTSRSLHRSMQCLNKGGTILISEEVAERLLPKFSRRANEREVHIQPVPIGTIEQLHELVKLVASGEIKPPPHTVFPAEEATEVVRQLVHSEIPGRAILKFHDIA